MASIRDTDSGQEPTPQRTRRLRPWLGRTSLLLVGLLVGALVSEIALRVRGYEGAHGRRQTVFDSSYGIVPPGNWVFRLDSDPTAQSQLRLRRQAVPLEKPPGETRMLFIGDSGTAGLFVEPNESYPQQFKELLDRDDPDNNIRVINAGVVGMTTVGEYYFLRDKLQFLNPDVVVLGLFMTNDINFNLGHQERRDARGASWVDALRQQSALGHFLQLRGLAANPRNQIWQASPAVGLPLIDSHGLHMLSNSAGEIATYMREPSELMERAFVVLRNVLQEVQDLGNETGFTFAVLLIPSRSAVVGSLDLPHNPRMLEELAKHDIHISESDLDFDLPTNRVRAICADLGIACIDPSNRMRRIGMHVFLPTDEHTTVLGHNALAQELLEHLDVLHPKD
jgi:hypothetical protein